MNYSILILFTFFVGVFGQKNVKYLLIAEKSQGELVTKFEEGITKAQKEATTAGQTIDMTKVELDRDNEDIIFNDTCGLLFSGDGYNGIVDISIGGWTQLRDASKANNFPYIRLEASNHQFVAVGDDYLTNRGISDAALIFETETDLDQSLYYLIGKSHVRVIVVNLEESDAFTRLSKLRPSASHYIAHGDAETIIKIYKMAADMNLVKRDSRWTFVSHDWHSKKVFNSVSQKSNAQITYISMVNDDCCVVMNQFPNSGNCDCTLMKNPNPTFIMKAAEILGKVADLNDLPLNTMNCYVTQNPTGATTFTNAIVAELTNSRYIYDKENMLLTYPLTFDVVAKNSTVSTSMGTWTTNDRYKKLGSVQYKGIPRFLKIGTVAIKPWASHKIDKDGNIMKDKNGKPLMEGYCIDMMEIFAKKMFFDYEIVLPTDDSNSYGKKLDDGTWSGLIGDLIKGEVDIAVAGLTTTSEREEVIDFVSPYFDQSGISIIIRKQVRPRSLFKFMEVLRTEVWFAILGALVITALMLWFLDRYSPYSAQNNQDAYPYPCRKFNLKESFWFALTSFTPQGGGEAPKSLSGRVLVAAYWLFVVLMLATFTANLAAFLTVERMQTTVQSLDELAQQSRINYTVVKDSTFLDFFNNMASAEEDLYEAWKDLTLSKTADQNRYRVWDYPIKEQYNHVLNTLKLSGLATSAQNGFQRVLDDYDGTFAFIHDASEIRYEYYNNCNFSLVGEIFAEQPIAVAVRQGSNLNPEIAKAILELQKDRYFETLSSRYWNSSLRSECPTLDDSEGITLRSLGGVFISTLIGLGIAMMVLAWEVYNQNRQNSVRDISAESRIINVKSGEGKEKF